MYTETMVGKIKMTKTWDSGVPICKSCSDQLITLGQYGYMNSKSLTVFLFPFLIYLPFLFRKKLFQLNYAN